VFWEGTTITSFLLVGFDHEKAKSRDSALQALIVTGMGGLGLLVALLMMGDIAGTYRLSEMNAMGDVFRDHTLYTAIFWLVVFGAFTKSAQWPFQFWLPGAMAAPTPVSAYLHSATMVKAGIYLLARFTPALGGTDVWIWVLTVVGAVTMVQASIWALRQTDLKLMMAYTTVMALGALTMLLGQGTPMAVTAAMAFILVHAFYKAALFLSVGMIDKGAGTREYLELGGLRGAMPLTFTVIAIAALSMAGFPPLFGFIGKELIYKSVEYASMPWFVGVMALAANALMVVCAGVVALRPFLGARQIAPKAAPADPGWGLWLGPVILAGLGVLGAVLRGPVRVLPRRADGAVGHRRADGDPPRALPRHQHGADPQPRDLRRRDRHLLRRRPHPHRADRGRPEDARDRERLRLGPAGGEGLRRLADPHRPERAHDPLPADHLRADAALVWGALYFGDPAWPAFAIGISLFEWAILGIIVASVG
jgi:multicomponent Na+:H+ antiporter subunit A